MGVSEECICVFICFYMRSLGIMKFIKICKLVKILSVFICCYYLLFGLI